MDKKTFNDGYLSINNQTMHIGSTTVNLSNISTVDINPCDRHSIFYGIKEWFFGLIIMIIICNIWRNLMIFGDLYIYTFFILIIYNVNEFRKSYYELLIIVGNSPIRIVSRKYDFLVKLRKIIEDAMENHNTNCTINIGEGTLINNGIINNGDNNINKVG